MRYGGGRRVRGQLRHRQQGQYGVLPVPRVLRRRLGAEPGPGSEYGRHPGRHHREMGVVLLFQRPRELQQLIH
jgi:hypothetical protein